MDKVKVITTLRMIAEDMAADAKAFDGRPFNGRTVAEYFGNQGAAIAALANIVAVLLEESEAPPHECEGQAADPVGAT